MYVERIQLTLLCFLNVHAVTNKKKKSKFYIL